MWGLCSLFWPDLLTLVLCRLRLAGRRRLVLLVDAFGRLRLSVLVNFVGRAGWWRVGDALGAFCMNGLFIGVLFVSLGDDLYVVCVWGVCWLWMHIEEAFLS